MLSVDYGLMTPRSGSSWVPDADVTRREARGAARGQIKMRAMYEHNSIPLVKRVILHERSVGHLMKEEMRSILSITPMQRKRLLLVEEAYITAKGYDIEFMASVNVVDGAERLGRLLRLMVHIEVMLMYKVYQTYMQNLILEDGVARPRAIMARDKFPGHVLREGTMPSLERTSWFGCPWMRA